MKKVIIIGLGLIGGSLAKDLKKHFGCEVCGVDINPIHRQKALALGFVDKLAGENDYADADVVIISIPVNKIISVAKEVLHKVKDNTLVFDVGSVKQTICAELETHPKRKNFLAAHPLAGTEFSGPEAAINDLFTNKVNVLCETDKTDWKILDLAFSLFKKLDMRIKMMNPIEHDRHIAYVSHLSHVTSFMLGKTVLEIEKNEQHIFDMASTGFASTVRLAKSSSAMWTPIFLENKQNVIMALEEYVKNLQLFKKILESNEEEELTKIMDNTNYIKNILNGIKEITI